MSFAPAAPWDRLRAWIDEKESQERALNRPAKLTQRELTAIGNLIPLIEEPDVSGRDHVSDLHQAAQVRKCAMPTFEDEAVTVMLNGVGEVKWRCYCTIGPQGTFPRIGYGLDQSGEAPIFATKKNAKQYAAQQTLAFLSNKPPSTAAPFAGAAPSPKRSDLPQAPPNPPHAKKVKTTTPEPVAAQPRSWQAEENSIYERVAYLADRLGLSPPAYVMHPVPGMPNFFSGKATFAPGSDGQIPDNVITVDGALGKHQVKNQLARQLCKWMENELKARNELFRSVLPPN